MEGYGMLTDLEGNCCVLFMKQSDRDGRKWYVTSCCPITKFGMEMMGTVPMVLLPTILPISRCDENPEVDGALCFTETF